VREGETEVKLEKTKLVCYLCCLHYWSAGF